MLLAIFQAHATDSLQSKPNKISIEFAAGITYCNYVFKKKYDYGQDNLTMPDSLNNVIGKSFALNVYFPIKKSNIYFVSGLGFIQRNTVLLVDEARYQISEPLAQKQNISYSFISLSLGFGYKIIEVKK